MRSVNIQAIGTAVPNHRASQSEVADFAKKVARSQRDGAGDNVDHDAMRERRRALAAIDRVYRQSAIERRSSVLEDFVRTPEAFSFFPANWALDPQPSTASRMEVYRREAPSLALRAAETCFERAAHVPRSAVTHVIFVSCTGFFAPGPDIELVRALGLRRDVSRQIIGFMGCYGAFNALRAARDACLADPEAVVLVVCVELCSIHFQRELTVDNIVANCLFSDGAGAALVASERGDARGRVALLDSYTAIEDDSLDQMTWTITDAGFRMTLASVVPDTLRSSVGPFVDTLLGRNGLGRRDVEFWAIHPGGRRIVEAIRDELALAPSDVATSLDVLAEHGNMSSATILFVLGRALDRAPRSGAIGVAMAFGPGLTLESLLLRAL
jgi:alpha-pyrone synthase